MGLSNCGILKLAWKLRGHTNVKGMRIAIENNKGEVRTGADKHGKKWQTKMHLPYGYFVGSKGADGDGVDCYIGPDRDIDHAYAVHQNNPKTGKYDEDKVMLGIKSKKDAKEAYLRQYDNPKFFGSIHRVSIERLRDLVRSKKQIVKIAKLTRLIGEFNKLRRPAKDVTTGVYGQVAGPDYSPKKVRKQ